MKMKLPRKDNGRSVQNSKRELICIACHQNFLKRAKVRAAAAAVLAIDRESIALVRESVELTGKPEKT